MLYLLTTKTTQTMKKINIFYWIITVLFCVLMAFGGFFDLVSAPEAIVVMKHLGYPAYLLPFLGVAKLLGILALLVPGIPRLKEWAYAGFFFDLTGALYSHISSGDTAAQWGGIFFGYALLFGSYLLHHKRLKAKMA
jgi:hypothetical protein